MLDTSDLEEANSDRSAVAAAGAIESGSIVDLAATLRKLPPLDPIVMSQIIGKVRPREPGSQKRTRKVSFSNNNVTIDIPARSSLSSEPTDSSVHSGSVTSQTSSCPSATCSYLPISANENDTSHVENEIVENTAAIKKSTSKHILKLIKQKIKTVLHHGRSARQENQKNS
jgi:hypothetical protein